MSGCKWFEVAGDFSRLKFSGVQNWKMRVGKSRDNALLQRKGRVSFPFAFPRKGATRNEEAGGGGNLNSEVL